MRETSQEKEGKIPIATTVRNSLLNALVSALLKTG